MLEREFEYYREHQEELATQHSGKCLAIVGDHIAGVFENELQAYTQMKKKYPVGTFLIQRCARGKNNYTQTFHSRVVFD